MTPNLTILPATHTELPTLVNITTAALATDPLTPLLYSADPTLAASLQSTSLLSSLGKRFTHPTNLCHIFKAVDSQNGNEEIVGWVLVRWEEGLDLTPPDAVPSSSSSPSPEKQDFMTWYQRQIQVAWLPFRTGKPHVGSSYSPSLPAFSPSLSPSPSKF